MITTVSIVTSSRMPSAIRPRAYSPYATAMPPMMNPETLPRICIRPTRALAIPTCGAGTRSGTYPWNGPWAKFELNCRSATKAAIASSSWLSAMPMRKTTSRTEPMKMYGLRRPQREIV